MIITLKIPSQLENYIRGVLKVEPTTYFQNEVMKPLLDKYEEKATVEAVVEAKENIKTEITNTRNSVKIEKVENQK